MVALLGGDVEVGVLEDILFLKILPAPHYRNDNMIDR
jgi:hypothetical protein